MRPPQESGASRTGQRWLRVGIWAILVMVLAGLALTYWFHRPSDEAPPVVRQIRDFELVDHEGRRFRSAELLGQVWVADFIFTRCRSTCPLMTAAMQRLRREWPGELPVRLVSISVDPRFDTPEVLRRYRGQHGITADDWFFLTGDRETILRLAREAFLLPVDDDPPPGQASEEMPILHSTRFVLVDADNRIRGYYNPLEEGELERLIREARSISTP